jgi:hypothetical protein
MRHIVSLRGHANVRDVIPDHVQWEDVGYTENVSTGFRDYTVSSRQIQGINQPVTFTVYYEYFSSLLYYKVTDSAPNPTLPTGTVAQDYIITDIPPDDEVFTPPSMTLIPSENSFDITVSNGQWITFASRGDPDTVTVSRGGVVVDTFQMFVNYIDGEK